MQENAKRLWLVRHAESQAQTGEFLGIDAPLSKLGTLQAERLKEPLSSIKFDIAYISPLKRARQTYEYSELNIQNVFFDTRIIEEMPQHSYNILLPYEELPGYGKPDTQNAWNIEAFERAKSFLSEISLANIKNILVITHSAFLNILLHALIKFEYKESEFYFGTNNCGISSIVLPSKETPRTTILFWNDITHVREFLGYDPMQ